MIGGMGKKGQVSILVAIIFQMVFILFAMVINVGVLIHDKINLQNSVDIAAYYGAMKQAEMMNAMGHVNFQLRQAWKLLSFRLWALSTSGINPDFRDTIPYGTDRERNFNMGTYTGGNRPVVCIFTNFFKEGYNPNTGKSYRANACRIINIPPIQTYKLNFGQQFFGFQALERAAEQAAQNFADACQKYGGGNHKMAGAIFMSYKHAVRKRRRHLKELMGMMVNDRDIRNARIEETVRNTFENNLTSGNLEGDPNLEYTNSIVGLPFLVPIETYVHMLYQDYPNGGGCTGQVKELKQPPNTRGPQDSLSAVARTYYGVDYSGPYNQMTPEQFLSESPNADSTWRSLVGVEKNPWRLAYVHVRATATPQLIFAPSNARITLQAEAYAMPFGGTIGPWHGTGWSRSANTSSGDPVDKLLPQRLTGGISGFTPQPPNYSRYPGDQYGMRSQVAQNVGLNAARGSFPNLPSLEDQYRVLYNRPESNAHEDMVVPPTNSGNLRGAELAAIAPDAFDVTYYSIQPQFGTYVTRHGEAGFVNVVCGGAGGRCPNDYGGPSPNPRQNMGTFSVTNQIGQVRNSPAFTQHAFWAIKEQGHIHTSWSHKLPDRYPADTGSMHVFRPEALSGRTGYSVKIVSGDYLKGQLNLGGTAGGGAIQNPPN